MECVDIHRIVDHYYAFRLQAIVFQQLHAHAFGERDYHDSPSVSLADRRALRKGQGAARPVAGLAHDQDGGAA